MLFINAIFTCLYWRYFLVKPKKVKKSNEQVLVINEVLTIAPVSIIVKSFVADSDTSISFFSENGPVKATELVSRDDSYVNKSFFYGDRPSRIPSSTNISNSTIRNVDASGQNGDKLSLIKLASFIEDFAKKGTQNLNLQNKVADKGNVHRPNLFLLIRRVLKLLITA